MNTFRIVLLVISYAFIALLLLGLIDSEIDSDTFIGLILILPFLITNIVFLHKSKSFIKSKVDELEERLRTIENQKKVRGDNRNSDGFRDLTDEEIEEVEGISL